MRNVLNVIPPEKNLPKMRIVFACAFFSSFLFYLFMTQIDSSNKDFLPGRVFIGLVSLAGFLLTYAKEPFKYVRLSLLLVFSSYIIVYGYFLYLNEWSVFHRWSYFVVVSIVMTTMVTWKDYVYLFLVGMIAPLFFIGSCPLSVLEIIHFYSALFVTFFVIGLTMRANFQYREDVINLTKNLITNSKMAAIGELSGNLSHEINNPLSILLLSCNQLQKNVALGTLDASKLNPSINRIVAASNRISYVVKGLSQFSQINENEEVTVIDLAELVREVASFFNEKLKADSIHLTIDAHPEEVLFEGRKSDIGQIFMILLTNAFDFTKVSSAPREVKVSFDQSDTKVKVVVQDSGPGVSEDAEDKIFEPFFTTKKFGEGMGMGLNTALGIANVYKGHIAFDRNISASAFVVTLPRY